MSSLEQSISVDYYKLLGVTRHSTVQEICAKYHRLHAGTATWHWPTTPPCSTTTPTPPTNVSPRQPRPSTSSTTVPLPSPSRKETHLRRTRRTKTQGGTTQRRITHRQVQVHHRPRRNLRKVLRIQECLRTPPRRRQKRRRVTPHLQGTVPRPQRLLQGAQPHRHRPLHPHRTLQRLHQGTHLQQKSTQQRRQKLRVREIDQNHNHHPRRRT